MRPGCGCSCCGRRRRRRRGRRSEVRARLGSRCQLRLNVGHLARDPQVVDSPVDGRTRGPSESDPSGQRIANDGVLHG
eukprot:5444328-Alexandrium_andersonii.AAC.1